MAAEREREREKEESNDPSESLAKAVGAVAGAAFAAWGIYKFFTGSESTSNTDKEAHQPPLAHFHSEAIVGSGTQAIARDVLVKWSLPQKGWVKINTDASLKSYPSSVAIGGVIRNDNGVWMDGFARRIPSCTIPQAELWAIKDGLMVAWDNGFKKIEVETDSEPALWLVNDSKVSNDELEGQLIQDCRNLLKRNWLVRLQHCGREANKAADYMANLGHSLGFEITYYDAPPMGAVPRLNRDLE